MDIRKYFELDGQRRALDGYSRFARGRNHWSVHEKLELYEASRLAFDPTAPKDTALRIFTNEIYNNLESYWQVFRTRLPGTHWTPQQTFDTIKREFSHFAWDSSVTLLNLTTQDKASLLSCLVKMEKIKPHRDYPIMAVSKFLHFYNPALFPIYDTEVIWKKCLRSVLITSFVSSTGRRDSGTKLGIPCSGSGITSAGQLI